MRIELPSGTPAELGEARRRRDARPCDRSRHLRTAAALRRPLPRRLSAEHGWAVVRGRAVPRSHAGRRRRALRRRCRISTTTACSATSSPVATGGNANVCLIGFCMGGMYIAQGRGALAFPPSRRLLRDDPHPARMEVATAWPSRSTSCANPAASRRSAIIGEQDPYTPPEDVDALERDTQVDGGPLPGRRARVRARSRPSRPPPRRRGRHVAARRSRS